MITDVIASYFYKLKCLITMSEASGFVEFFIVGGTNTATAAASGKVPGSCGNGVDSSSLGNPPLSAALIGNRQYRT